MRCLVTHDKIVRQLLFVLDPAIVAVTICRWHCTILDIHQIGHVHIEHRKYHKQCYEHDRGQRESHIFNFCFFFCAAKSLCACYTSTTSHTRHANYFLIRITTIDLLVYYCSACQRQRHSVRTANNFQPLYIVLHNVLLTHVRVFQFVILHIIACVKFTAQTHSHNNRNFVSALLSDNTMSLRHIDDGDDFTSIVCERYHTDHT